MSRSSRGNTLFVGMVLLCLSACASQTEVIKLYESETQNDAPYQRLLIIDESTDSGEREHFEEMLAAAATSSESNAVASHSLVGFDVTVTDDVLAEAVKKADADAVLITQIASVETSTTTQVGRVNVVPTCRKGEFYDPFLYDYPEVKEPDRVIVSHTVVVIASLYDAADNERLWTIQSTCFDKRSSMAFMADQSVTIAAELRQDGLLR